MTHDDGVGHYILLRAWNHMLKQNDEEAMKVFASAQQAMCYTPGVNHVSLQTAIDIYRWSTLGEDAL